MRDGVASDGRLREKGRVEKPRELLVDGHNVLHAWGWLRVAVGVPAVAVARSRLVEAVRAIHDIEGIAVTIVFDGRGEKIALDPAEDADGFAVVYAPANLTADTVIERAVAASADPRACIVATFDQPERETVRASGAECISPADLESWITRCKARVAAKSQTARAGQRFENKLPL